MARAGRRSGTSTTSCRPRPVEGRLGELERRADGRREVELLERAAAPSAASPSASASSERDSRTSRSASSHERVVGRPVGRDDAVAQRLEVALQVRQRRAQLVRRVGDEVAAHRLLALEAGGHLVERIGQAGELLGALARDAGRVVALGDPPGRRRRPRRAAGRASGPGRPRARCSPRRRPATAARTTVVTDSSYIAWAWSAESPASTIRPRKISAPTTVTPIGQDREPDAPPRRAPRARSGWRSRAPITGRRRPIADAADGGDVARMLGVVAELVAQAPDVDVDRPVEHLGLVAAVDRVEQLVAGQDAAVGLDERWSSRNSTRVSGDRRAVAGSPRGGRGRRRGRPVTSGGRADGVRASVARGPAQDRLDAQDELGRGERLGQVVVGAVLEAGDPVERRAARRQDEDRRGGRRRRRRGRPG